MKIARVILSDNEGDVWAGTLTQFARDNSMSRDEVHEICAALRVDSDGNPGQWHAGGGAAPEYWLVPA